MANALVTGSFDPVTVGHFALIEKAARAFDTVVVAIFRNPDKVYFFTEEERRFLIETGLRELGLANVSVDISDGYVADYAKEKGIGFVVRGVRNADDMAYELEMARYNNRRNPELETFLWGAPAEQSDLSSTKVREYLKKGEIPKALLLPSVAEAIATIQKK